MDLQDSCHDTEVQYLLVLHSKASDGRQMKSTLLAVAIYCDHLTNDA
jgi:hypothetical protein